MKTSHADENTITVESHRVKLTVEVIKKSKHGDSAGNDYEASFWFHGGTGTPWISMDGDGKATFELWSFFSVAYVAVRSKANPVVLREHDVQFFQNVHKFGELKENTTVIFVLRS